MIYYESDSVKLINSDCLEALKTMDDNFVDSIVSDPPAGINFMNLAFDSDKGGRDQWIAWLEEIMVEAKRVIKPGGHILIWSLPRTGHWTATAIENAGFEIIDVCVHMFGTGFPKSMSVSKQLDKMAGAEREVVGFDKSKHRANSEKNHKEGQVGGFGLKAEGTGQITAPATDEAKEWEGWGTALKPAHEDWILARKPISEKNISLNVLKHGTGAINIDASRVNSFQPGEFEKLAKRADTPRQDITSGNFHANAKEGQVVTPTSMSSAGRFPANVMLSHSPNCVNKRLKKIKGITGSANGRTVGNCSNIYGNYKGTGQTKGEQIGYVDKDGMETVEDWDCTDDCPVRAINEQSGNCPGCKTPSKAKGSGIYRPDQEGYVKQGPIYPGNGGAARFYTTFSAEEQDIEIEKTIDPFPFLYCAKPSGKEKNAGLKSNRFQKQNGTEENNHPTVKSLELMKYLVTLITPPNGTVLDMFMGSGSTGCAASICGFKFIGIELEKDYCDIAKRRIIHWKNRGQL